MNKKLITRRGSLRAVKRVNILTGFFVLLLALLVSTSIASSVFAAGYQAGPNRTLSGDVTVVDNLHHYGMLTLRSGEIGQFPNDRLNIFMNNGTAVKICSEREPERDLKVSRDATVTYHEVGGVPLAISVSEKC